MKKTIINMMLTLALVLGFSIQANAQNRLIPEITLGEMKIKLYGFTHVVYDDELDDWDMSNLRLRTKIDLRQFGFFSEVNFAHCQDKDSNWLRQAYLIYHLNEDWEIRAGRLFLSGGNVSPNPFTIETVEKPMSDFFNTYAWGFQTVGNLGDGWKLSADISGDSGKPFQSQENWKRVEVSARLEKKIDTFLIAGTTQLLKNCQRLSADVTWSPRSNYYIRSAIFGEDKQVRVLKKNSDNSTSFHEISDRKIGANVISVWRPVSFLEVHNQVDFVRHTFQAIKSKDVVMTNGIRFFAGKEDMFSVTADWQTVLEGKKEDRFLLRAQMMF